MSAILTWISDKLPKVYLLNTLEYPKYEFPLGSGVKHEYPSYNVFGKRLPNAYFGLIGLGGLFGAIKLVTMLVPSKPEDKTIPALTFPAPKRDFAAEKQEFIQKYLEIEEKKEKYGGGGHASAH